MDKLALLFLVVSIILIYMCCFSSEQMLNEVDWANTSRGLNASNYAGYESSIYMLNKMEKSSPNKIEI